MQKTISFIGGGQMAEALIKGMISAGTCSASQLVVAEPVASRCNFLEATYQVRTVTVASEAVDGADLLILAVKPQVMAGVLRDIKDRLGDQLIITIAAGLPLAFYGSVLEKPSHPLIRVMPNMPALIQQAASSLCRNSAVSNEDLAYAQNLFSAVGQTVIVEERLMDAVTGLSGSGPAFVFSFIEALIDAGVKVGLSRDAARNLAVQTVIGSAQLLRESGEHPAVLRDRVTSPGGTTASGLHSLEQAGFHGIVMNAVEAAVRRSTELGS